MNYNLEYGFAWHMPHMLQNSLELIMLAAADCCRCVYLSCIASVHSILVRNVIIVDQSKRQLRIILLELTEPFPIEHCGRRAWRLSFLLPTAHRLGETKTTVISNDASGNWQDHKLHTSTKFKDDINNNDKVTQRYCATLSSVPNYPLISHFWFLLSIGFQPSYSKG